MDFQGEVTSLDIAPVETEDVFMFPRLETVPEMHDRPIAALAL